MRQSVVFDMREFTAQSLLSTPTVRLWDVCCQGCRREKSEQEAVPAAQLVFPYRGVYVRHRGNEDAVAEANQVLFFNAREEYRVSHPVPGGDASLVLVIDEQTLCELVPRTLIHVTNSLAFRRQRQRLDGCAQALVALLRHTVRRGIVEPLEAEVLALSLAQRALGANAPGANAGRQKLVDRVKLILASDPARRWTLADIAAQVRGSPVYLTQVFRQVEGVPLYRYQLRLRLSRALHLLPRYDDLTTLGLDLGFSSHSHFSAAFRSAYGLSPSQFRRALHHRPVIR